ncbi:3-oxoacyl-[acyl-carrier-protein] synthase 2 [Anaplasma platys]|uniref:3-oxoacyl-[acyl-carrier-protein] synthase 2 n=1 Tax=Anaplasma platys TaxID=949 RepID=A0A858PYU8_9RICK|nr:beta-ketoacyl-ACP synthase II [Anaplasma platys]QJC27740.1 3-oxoacyl-[acyl-carrier-protein] synthase 2 [Anaplasma platys]
MSETRRVVVTGVGLVTSFGVDTSAVWDCLVSGKSGIDTISRFDVEDLDCKIGGQIRMSGESENYVFDPTLWIDDREVKKVDYFILFGIAAADLAVKDSGVMDCTLDPGRVGVAIGSGIGGLPFIEKNITALNARGPKRVSAFFIPGSLINLLQGHISIRHGFEGYCSTVVGACASGAMALADAARAISCGTCDVVIAGGSEGAICRSAIAGFSVIKALSTKYNDSPSSASRPWDEGRDGFVMGEGAGMMVLESYEHAKRRGAKIYAELVGYGITSDAHHVTAPHPEGTGGANAMRQALKCAGLSPTSIDYINAHGTSTPVGDSVEVTAVKSVFGDHAYKLAMSSTKSSIGHLLGAAGSVEAVFSVLSMNSGVIPPTLNLHSSTEDSGVNLVPHVAQERKISHVLSNSFGFGGVNASLIFAAV